MRAVDVDSGQSLPLWLKNSMCLTAVTFFIR